MKNTPDAVCIYIPLMKDLGMSWSEIKKTPRIELEGILAAMSEHSVLHSFDGYTSDDVGEMAKNKPEVRSAYNSYREANARLRKKLGRKVKKPQSFSGLLSG